MSLKERFNAAVRAQQQNNTPQALYLYQELLPLATPELAWKIHANLAQLFADQNKSISAANHLRQALVYPALAADSRAYLYLQLAQQSPRKEPLLRQSWTCFPLHATGRQLIQHYLHTNDLLLARYYLSELEQLLERSFHPVYLHWCADLRMGLKDFSLARQNYRRLLAKEKKARSHNPYMLAHIHAKLAATYPRTPAFESRIQAAYAEALTHDNALEWHLSALCHFPGVYDNKAHIEDLRQTFTESLQTFIEKKLSFKSPLNLQHLPFHLPYQTPHDRLALELFSACVRQGLPQWKPPEPQKPFKKQGPIRVGVISRFFYNHSVMRCFIDLITGLVPPDFEWIALEISPLKHDEFTAELRATATQWLVLKGDILEQCDQVQSLGLDILIYTDTLLDPHSYLLSHYRLAPVQMLLPGQPVTSGVNTLDYFISDAYSESDAAQQHYTEKLCLLEAPPSGLRPPLKQAKTHHPLPIPDLSRQSLGLPEGTLYICPAQLQKMHPDMDEVFRGVLEQDSTATILCIAFEPELAKELQQRLKRTSGLSHTRIYWHKPWEPSLFLSVLTHCRVMLESFPFGSGNTLISALQAELPVLALSQPTLKGRYALGILHWIGIPKDWIVADDTEALARKAVYLAHNETLQQDWKVRLRAGQHKIFDTQQSRERFLAMLQQLHAAQSANPL